MAPWFVSFYSFFFLLTHPLNFVKKIFTIRNIKYKELKGRIDYALELLFLGDIHMGSVTSPTAIGSLDRGSFSPTPALPASPSLPLRRLEIRVTKAPDLIDFYPFISRKIIEIDISLYVYSYLTVSETCLIAPVSKSWKKVSQDKRLWRFVHYIDVPMREHLSPKQLWLEHTQWKARWSEMLQDQRAIAVSVRALKKHEKEKSRRNCHQLIVTPLIMGVMVTGGVMILWTVVIALKTNSISWEQCAQIMGGGFLECIGLYCRRYVALSADDGFIEKGRVDVLKASIVTRELSLHPKLNMLDSLNRTRLLDVSKATRDLLT